MIMFIDLLNWAATLFVWVLGFLVVAGIVIGFLNLILPPLGFLPNPKPRDLRVEAQARTATRFESRVWGACVALWFILVTATAVMKSQGYL